MKAASSIFLCGGPPSCSTTSELNFYSCREASFNSCRGSSSAKHKNLITARTVIQQVFRDLEAECLAEKSHYEKASLEPSAQKSNRWEAYTNKDRLRSFMSESMEFIRQHAECRTRELSDMQLRFLILLQHLVAEDTSDFYRPENERKHQDAFEGFLTQAVNSQLIKDAHRSEWSVEGRTFSLQTQLAVGNHQTSDDRKKAISAFQEELVTSLEEYLLAFASRRELSSAGTRHLLQAITTQMSQCGLANLDRSSQAAKYFVSGQGLDQRTAYSLSTMDTGHALGESLKVSMFCMKTGFTQYLDKQDEKRMAPRTCHPSSYLYQYATLQFVPLRGIGNTETIACTIIDALDEIEIVPENLEEVGI
mmetsp:Transcript_26605/g.48972  ORF Transcript_26605/g.48972 Transcript_26605/m.48972 type:complete len:364 (-) Transcript_26605:100-1191(-)